MPDQALTISGAGTGAVAPLAYTVPGTGEIILKAAFARLDGTAAVGSWLPCLRVKTPNGGIMLECIGTTVAAGASADVTWFPDVSGGGGTAGTTSQIQIPLDTPDINGNAIAELTTRNGFATVRRILPTFQNGLDGNWTGSLAIPNNYASGATMKLLWVANATTGNLRHSVATSVVAVGGAEDAAYTTEAYVNTTVPGTANQLFTTSFTLSTASVAGSHLNVQVLRNGSNVLDTLAVAAQLLAVIYQYISS